MNNPCPENVNVHKGHANGERMNLASLIEKCKKYMYLCINVWILYMYLHIVRFGCIYAYVYL
jgi:hypothetical protein